MPNVTKVFIKKYPDYGWNLLNRITSSSKFKNIKVKKPTASDPDPQESLEEQLRIANEMIDGWKSCGPWPKAEYRIEQNGEVVK